MSKSTKQPCNCSAGGGAVSKSTSVACKSKSTQQTSNHVDRGHVTNGMCKKSSDSIRTTTSTTKTRGIGDRNAITAATFSNGRAASGSKRGCISSSSNREMKTSRSRWSIANRRAGATITDRKFTGGGSSSRLADTARKQGEFLYQNVTYDMFFFARRCTCTDMYYVIYIEGIIVLIFLYYILICLYFITHLIGACTSDGKKGGRGRSGGLLSLGCITGSRNKSSSGAKRRPSSVLKKEEQSRDSMNVLTKYQGSGDGNSKAENAACK